MYKQSSREIFRVIPAIVGAYINGNLRVSAVQLGRRYGINCRTLNVNMQRLILAGILYSQTGGHNPGYGFARDPKSVSLFDVAQAICHIEYPRCSLVEHTEDKRCIVCGIVCSAIDQIINNLKATSCYDLYISLEKGKKKS